MELNETARRDNVRIGDVLQIAWDRLTENFLVWIGLTLLFIVVGWGGMAAIQALLVAMFGGSGGALVNSGGQPDPALLFGALAGNFVAGSLAGIWVGLLTLGYWGAAIRGALGLSVGVGDLFAQLRKFLKYIVQAFLLQTIKGFFAIAALVVFGIAILDMIDITHVLDTPFSQWQNIFDVEFFMTLFRRVGWILAALIVPFVYVVLGLFFSQLELTYNDASGPVSSIIHAWRIASKHRLQMLGLSAVIAVCFMMGAIPCGLGLVLAMPFGSLAFAALFIALRNGADVPKPDTTTTLRGDTRPRDLPPRGPGPLPGGGGDVAPVDSHNTPSGTWS